MAHISLQRLKGRKAVITGGSRGIGRAVAVRFASEGAAVCINHYDDSNAANETLEALFRASKESGHGTPDHFSVAADVSKFDSASQIVTTVLSNWSGFDIVINNAGVMPPTPATAVDPASVERTVGVNLLGAAYVATAACAYFRSRPGGGVIVNTSSVHEVIPKPGYFAYSISKGGLGNLTRTLALEFVRDGIRVNSVAPGAVITAMNKAWTENEERKRVVESHIPLGRAATPEEIAPIFAFLASDEASYITGQTIFACGGLTLYADFIDNWSS